MITAQIDLSKKALITAGGGKDRLHSSLVHINDGGQRLTFFCPTWKSAKAPAEALVNIKGG